MKKSRIKNSQKGFDNSILSSDFENSTVGFPLTQFNEI